MGAVLFEVAAREFLAHHRIYSEDPETMHYQFQILLPAFRGRALKAIDVPSIERFLAARLKAGKSKATLNRNRAALSVFFGWAIGRGHHPGPNPIAGVRKFRESRGRTRYLSPQEADRLELAASAHLKPILVTAIYSGGRHGEVLALQWRDLDLEADVLTFHWKTTKSRRTRSVPIVPKLHATLKALRRGQPDQPVFTWNEQRLKKVKTSFGTAWRKARISGRPDFKVLRHTFASWYMLNGGDINVLKEYLGHSTIRMTERYAHLSRERLKSQARFIGPPRVGRPAAEEEQS